MNRAVDISVGSLSPTINWKTLRHQEFRLPPKNIQEKLADMFSASEMHVQAITILVEKILSSRFSVCELCFTKGNKSFDTKPFYNYLIPSNWNIKKTSDVASVEYGISKSVANNKDPNIGWQIITGANINLDGTINLEKKRYIEEPTKERFLLERGDLLFNWRSGSPEHIGKTAIFDLRGSFTYASFILRIRCGKEIDNLFAYYLFNHLRNIEFFTRDTSKQVNFKINAAIFREIKIPVPPLEIQIDITKKIHSFDRALLAARKKLETAMHVRTSLTSQVF